MSLWNKKQQQIKQLSNIHQKSLAFQRNDKLILHVSIFIILSFDPFTPLFPVLHFHHLHQYQSLTYNFVKAPHLKCFYLWVSLVTADFCRTLYRASAELNYQSWICGARARHQCRHHMRTWSSQLLSQNKDKRRVHALRQVNLSACLREVLTQPCIVLTAEAIQ